MVNLRTLVGDIQMRWEKRGHIFAPPADSWMHAYAQVPTPLVFEDFIRIYFGCRPKTDDPLPISRIGFVDVARDRPTAVLRYSDTPVLQLGDTGCFDEFGLHPNAVMRVGDEVWMYYTGWTRMQSVPFNRAIGLAVSKDGGVTFERHARGPVVGAALDEPYLLQGAHVQVIDDVWHMWYLSGRDWIPANDGRMEAIYGIAHATSSDGIHWLRDGQPIIETLAEHECQAGQAVIFLDGAWHMWFSYRRGLDFRNAAGGYRMGYAYSHDLIHWQRDDSRAGISVSDSGWDSEMIGYPAVVQIAGKIWMFYCGNYFGRGGFGYAELMAE